MHSCQDVEPLLTPYVDGESTDSARPIVEGHLAECPACRERAGAERQVRALLQVRGPSLRAEAAPPGLDARCRQAAATAPVLPVPVGRYWAPLSMAATVLLVIAVGAFFALRGIDTTALAAELTADHRQCFRMAPAGPAAARDVEARWLEQHGWSLSVPDGSGSPPLTLLDVRNCRHSDGDSAHILYRSHGQAVSLFVRPASRPSAPTAAIDGQSLRSWTTADHQYTLVVDRDTGEVDALVSYLQNRVE